MESQPISLDEPPAKHDDFRRFLEIYFSQWKIFSRSRGKRSRLLSRFLKSWKDAMDTNNVEKQMLGRVRRTLFLARTRHCLNHWTGIMETSFILHGYQLHRILHYLKYSTFLCLPPTFVHQSPRLLLIQHWKLVRLLFLFITLWRPWEITYSFIVTRSSVETSHHYWADHLRSGESLTHYSYM